VTEPLRQFKRMLIGLPHRAEDYAGVGVSAKVADLLGVRLVATFVEDTTLFEAAALPCVREWRPLGGGWRPMEASQLDREFERAAAAARRYFHHAVGTTRVEASFNVVRGSAAEVVGSAAMADDIIVLIEPRNPAERITQQFTRLVEGAFDGAAAVMIVPSRIVRTAGPVAAVMLDADDPSIRSALAIAAAAGEGVIVLGPAPSKLEPVVGELAEAAGVRIEFAPRVREPVDAESLLATLAPMNERMVVMRREERTQKKVSALALQRRIPILLMEAKKDGAERNAVGCPERGPRE
jgi:hypothetical protein